MRKKRPFKRIAVLMDTTVAPRRQMLGGVARYIHEHEPWALYLKPYGVEKSLEDWLTGWNGDGIIAAIGDFDAGSFGRIKIPTVDVSGLHGQADAPLVRADDHAVGRVGAEHLIERGFRSFAFVEFAQHFWSVNRRKGFEEVLASHGYPCQVHQLPYPYAGTGGPGQWEHRQSELCDWISQLPKPTGVMCSTDLMGQQFLEACLRAEVSVPEEIAVIGADNDEQICQVACPPLSSVIINDEQRGYVAASVLDKMMAGEKPANPLVLIPPIGVCGRMSTDILSVDDDAVIAALRLIRDHACDGISVDEVVKTTLLSRSALERRFRKAVKRPMNTEIIRVRLNRAVELLCKTNLELKVIARKAGLGNSSYMTALFRKKLGRTPGSYRRPHRTVSEA